MKRRTLLLFIIVPLAVILTVTATVLVSYRSLIFRDSKGVEFSGTITATDIHCDGKKASTIAVDNKTITVKLPTPSDTSTIGYTDLNLCGVFGSPDSYGKVLKRQGDPNIGDRLVGRTVDVYAKEIDATHYTLEGSADYHVTGA